VDGRLARQAGPRPRHLVAGREAPPAFSVGRPGEVTYRWRNGAPRTARLRLREVRPELLGGAQPPRWIRVPARGQARETVPVTPARRGRQTEGGFVLDSVGPLGLGLRRERIALRWEVAVYPPLVTVRLQPQLVEPDYPRAFRYLAARNRKRALTVLFTDVIDRFASDALVANVASLRPRHLPLAVTLQNPELNHVAALRPAAAHDAFRKAAAEELLRAREEALGRMRRAGVPVLVVPPERAAEAVVAKYLDLKRRGRL